MKTKKMAKKLVFSKETITRLDSLEMLRAAGLGDDYTLDDKPCSNLPRVCTDTCGSANLTPVCPCMD